MIHYFNPGHEVAVRNASPYYMLPSNIALMQKELAFLPGWYASKSDVIFLDNEIDVNYYSFLYQNLYDFPEFIVRDKLIDHKNEEIMLWGISPQAIRVFEELNKEYDLNLKTPEWQQEYVYLNSRHAAKDCLTDLMNLLPKTAADIMPRFCTALDEIEAIVQESDYPLLAKAPFSSSGRGLLWLPLGILTRTERQILHGILKKQGSVSLERVLNNQLDFAMEFTADGRGNIMFEGYSLFETNKKGAYQGNYLLLQENIEKQLSAHIDLSKLNVVKEALIHILSQKYTKLYKGCIGVDMMLYIQQDGSIALHPCLEINMRYNMGFLALKMKEKYICRESQGRFFIEFSSQKGEIFSMHQKMEKDYPACFEEGRLKTGYLSLCPVRENNHYRAYVLVE